MIADSPSLQARLSGQAFRSCLPLGWALSPDESGIMRVPQVWPYKSLEAFTSISAVHKPWNVLQKEWKKWTDKSQRSVWDLVNGCMRMRWEIQLKLHERSFNLTTLCLTVPNTEDCFLHLPSMITPSCPLCSSTMTKSQDRQLSHLKVHWPWKAQLGSSARPCSSSEWPPLSGFSTLHENGDGVGQKSGWSTYVLMK